MVIRVLLVHIKTVVVVARVGVEVVSHVFDVVSGLGLGFFLFGLHVRREEQILNCFIERERGALVVQDYVRLRKQQKYLHLAHFV